MYFKTRRFRTKIMSQHLIKIFGIFRKIFRWCFCQNSRFYGTGAKNDIHVQLKLYLGVEWENCGRMNHSIYMTQTGVTILKNLYLKFSDYRRKLSYLIQFEGLNFGYSSSFWLSPVDSGFLWSRKFNGYLIHRYKMILVIQGLLRIWQFNSHFIVGLKTVTLVGHHHHPKWWRHNDDYVTPNSKCG